LASICLPAFKAPFRRNWKIGVSQRLESQPSSPENAVEPRASLHYWLLCGLTLRRKNPRLHRPQPLGYRNRIRSFRFLDKSLQASNAPRDVVEESLDLFSDVPPAVTSRPKPLSPAGYLFALAALMPIPSANHRTVVDKNTKLM
jgi:hypothetical protein